MTTSLEVRQELVNALKLDLVGPWPGHELAEERLPSKSWPSYWYLTGFLIPTGSPPEQSSDYDGDDDLSEAPLRSGVPGESTEEEKAAKKSFFPSSMGISFLISQVPQTLQVAICWGDYHLIEEQLENSKVSYWQRQAREEFIRLDMPLQTEAAVYDLPNATGLQLHVVQRLIRDDDFTAHIPSGTRSISIFLVNHRPPQSGDLRDQAYVFQPEIEISSQDAFVPRPDPRGALAEDWDDQVADLHYADTPEFATGHGVSAEWDLLNGQCRILRTAWIPSAEVEKMETIVIPDVELQMDTLGGLSDGQALKTALRPLVSQYREWIQQQGKPLSDLSDSRQEVARELLRQANLAALRIEQGIEMLSQDADALDAFRVANRAVSRALKKRLNIPNPSWRAFQLAFILLNLKGMVDPTDPHRETVDLLFFPTGGGKTEAYLGLAAFAMVLCRLKHPQDQGYCGAGVSVVMRYTLRLLTLDQLGRAAGLTCALELEREENLDRYGHWPFEIGLWVGKAATPNILGKKGDGNPDSARTKVRQYKRDPQSKPSPIPLENCPWCGERFEPDSFTLEPNDDQPTELRIICTNFECDFSGDHRPLPILAVDEGIYRRLPAFLISTVDKFASLPWIAQSGVLLGGAVRYSEKGFYGAAETGQGQRLTKSLQPPDLIIQDEMHLISGPLGTMAGLYEAAIEALSLTDYNGQTIRPKIVASTATVRRAQEQIQALFGRALTQIFPPPGPERKDAFFAKTAPANEIPARLYVGVAAQGRNPKEIMRRVWLVLMGAAQNAYQAEGGTHNPQNPADPYMTVLGYFNSLRELGGARRILEEQVQNTIKGYSGRKRLGEQIGLFSDRHNFSEVLELTSRVPTNKVAEARRRLESLFNSDQRVDCAIATNMISVGLDIPRLGLMVVFAQPKTHAEYIQATSRVGRDSDRPGLVVTVLNIHRPRDRSHYERFKHYHETFYRSVEAGSVTPFSARALDRGMAGAVVALARHIENPLTPAKGVSNIGQVRTQLEEKLLHAFYDRVNAQPMDDPNERAERLLSVKNRVVDLLDSWVKIVQNYHNQGITVTYQEYEEPRTAKPLLRGMLETDFETVDHRKFRANRSLRDVEPEVNVFIKDLNGMLLEEVQ
ncbi:MAG: helicase [Candidatus Sericytochromatia bacterium]|nr:helicase [Candidatus Sericytochromatia bacterium]